MEAARQEYPNPMLYRAEWLNLNGTWEFYENRRDEKKTIQVPFCPESMLSGIGNTDFMPEVWYQKEIQLTREQCEKHVVLHFGAVDYEAEVFINGNCAGSHVGGYTAFEFEITEWIAPGSNVIRVHVKDNNQEGMQPSGKQSSKKESSGCFYTRTTGIWQTVWLEFLPEQYIKEITYYTDPDNQKVTLVVCVHGTGTVHAFVAFQDRPMGAVSAAADGICYLEIQLKELHLWKIGCGNLYDVSLSFEEDHVMSYFGMKKIEIRGSEIRLNDQPVFLRMVLDQGYYPDGIYTAPGEEDMIHDIQISQQAGFDGARLHQRVAEPRFLYHCDRMGYFVWGEYADWGMNLSSPEIMLPYLKQWREAVISTRNHPSILAWCPFNETWDYQGRRPRKELIQAVYEETKMLDPSRPCIDASGFFHVKTDLYDVHDYEQNPDRLASYYQQITPGVILDQIERTKEYSGRQQYGGQPFLVSEYGGIGWWNEQDEAWGYGDIPKSKEEFLKRYQQLTMVLLQNPKISGFCYTQLYDVEQEKNGLYTCQREPKFDMEFIANVNQQKAKVEESNSEDRNHTVIK